MRNDFKVQKIVSSRSPQSSYQIIMEMVEQLRPLLEITEKRDLKRQKQNKGETL